MPVEQVETETANEFFDDFTEGGSEMTVRVAEVLFSQKRLEVHAKRLLVVQRKKLFDDAQEMLVERNVFFEGQFESRVQMSVDFMQQMEVYSLDLAKQSPEGTLEK